MKPLRQFRGGFTRMTRGRMMTEMTGAQLQVTLDWLGLDQRALSQILDVDERTVRRWVAGARIPTGVTTNLAAIEAATDRAVDEVVTALGDDPDGCTIGVYQRAEDMWSARPEFEPYPTGWWRMVVARAVRERPGARLVFIRDGAGQQVTHSLDKTFLARQCGLPSWERA